MEKQNIRQVGQVRGNRKVYIEDYAMTYLKNMAERGENNAKLAVLVGEYEKKEIGDCFYIYGVLDIPSEGQGVGYQMDNVAWTRIYGDIKLYFPQMEILGWYLTGEEIEVERNDWLQQFHRDYFAGESKLFFYYYPVELEEKIYLYESGALKLQGGYYIFYEKNAAMQSLLIEKNQSRTNRIRESCGVSDRILREKARKAEEEQQIWQNNDDAAEKKQSSEWEKEQEKEQERKPGEEQHRSLLSSYLTGAVTAAAVLSLCLVIFQYFDRLDGLEKSMQQLTEQLMQTEIPEIGDAVTEEPVKSEENGSGRVLEIETMTGGVVQEAEQSERENKEIGQSENREERTEEANRNVGEKEQKDMENNQENERGDGKQETMQTAVRYVVQPGDTLSGICQKHYRNIHKVEEVMKANHLTDANGILAGDVLLLP